MTTERTGPVSSGLVSAGLEHRLSGEGFANASVDHAAASRSSDGSGNLSDLERLIEGAAEGSRELFTTVYAACNGGRLFADPATPDFKATFARWDKFERLLRAEAYLDAAMSLVPEGWHWSLYDTNGFEGDYHRAVAQLEPKGFDTERLQEGQARTPALALCAAALKARALSLTGEERGG